MKTFLTIFSFILICSSAVAQPDEVDYVREITWGVNKNTNSGLIGGLVFKLGLQQKDNLYTTYGLEFINVRHNQEYRYQSSVSGTPFIWGKQNFLYSIRGRYGREVVMFRKAQQQGVQISAVFAGGPTIGIIAPYYILFNGEYVPFNPQVHNNYFAIQGSGKLFQGLGESDVTFGLNAKAGLSFEFGAFKNNVAGVEVGVSMEAFPQEIILVPTQENSAIFTALYFNLYWGTRR